MTDERAIREIVVVGGGTAGWLSASWLDRALNSDGGARCAIMLIESPDIPTIGVGEATIDSLPDTLAFLGVDEDEWMRHCQATFKLAVKFVNWSGGGHEDVFWHPFGDLPMTSERTIPRHQLWLGARASGHERDLYDSCFEAVALCRRAKAPRRRDMPAFRGEVDYGYQLDAALFAEYLRDRARRVGIRVIRDTVLDVALDQRGFIRHVVTASHGAVAGDLFLDCTGFRGLLVQRALREPWLDYSRALFCDRAVVIQTARAGETQVPYTAATALDAGWVWTIPLHQRTSHGYVHSSEFLSAQQAEDELRAHLGAAASDAEARHLRFRIGKTRQTWVKNCVAIGLAGGFIEPLESTGIALVELGLEYLLYHFPDRSCDARVARHYNQVMTRFYEEIRDFLVLHYCLTRRRDTPFWQTNAAHPAIPDTLLAKLDGWRGMWPNNPEPPGLLFPDYSYACILAGHGRIPARPLPYLAYLDAAQVTGALGEVAVRANAMASELPSHEEYLAGIHRP